jgi:hypothetical protein
MFAPVDFNPRHSKMMRGCTATKILKSNPAFSELIMPSRRTESLCVA